MNWRANSAPFSFGAQLMIIKLINGVFQDGADFYREIIGPDDEAISEHIKSYPNIVKNDYDMEGARKAREAFAKEFPQDVKA
jgi:hypothetical protein